MLNNCDKKTNRGINKDTIQYYLNDARRYIDKHDLLFEKKYGDYLNQVSKKYNIDRAIIKYMIMLESCFRQNRNDIICERIAAALIDLFHLNINISVGIAQISSAALKKCNFESIKYLERFNPKFQFEVAAKLIKKYDLEYLTSAQKEDKLRYIICEYHGATTTRNYTYVDVFYNLILDKMPEKADSKKSSST